MHYIVSLDYLVKRASLVGSGAVCSICYPYLHYHYKSSFLSISSLYGPKSEKKEATVHINPLLGGFFFRRSSLFFVKIWGKSTGKMLRLQEKKSCWKWCYYTFTYTVKAEPSWKALYLYFFFSQDSFLMVVFWEIKNQCVILNCSHHCYFTNDL